MARNLDSLQEVVLKPTARELDVFRLVEEGLGNIEIGQRLYLSPETIKSHVRHVLSKTHTTNRAAALAVLIRRGWV